jgi:hypothetical protein
VLTPPCLAIYPPPGNAAESERASDKD